MTTIANINKQIWCPYNKAYIILSLAAITVLFCIVIINFILFPFHREYDLLRKRNHPYHNNIEQDIADYWLKYDNMSHDHYNETLSLSLINMLYSENISNLTNVSWVKYACPDVYNYFKIVSYFPSFPTLFSGEPIGILTTQYALIYSCLLDLTVAMFHKCNISYWIYAGTQIGAHVHGGLTPWDDDVDVAIRSNDSQKLLKCGAKYKNHAVTMFDENNVDVPIFYIDKRSHLNAYKLWMNPTLYLFPDFSTGDSYKWPLIDIFLLKTGDFAKKKNVLCEVDLKHNLRHPFANKNRHPNCFTQSETFPLLKYYVNGMFVDGPRTESITKRYNLDICIHQRCSHRVDQRSYCSKIKNLELDCKLLSQFLPKYYHFNANQSYLIYGTNILIYKENNVFYTDDSKNKQIVEYRSDYSGAYIQLKKDVVNNDLNFTEKYWFISEITKTKILRLYSQSNQSNNIIMYNAYSLTKEYLVDNPNIDINKIEICNEIYNVMEPKDDINMHDDDNVNIIEINAERGTKWIDLSRKLRLLQITENRNIDIIILNEMDIGMARSNNLHTTRLLAESLNMNFVFGVEFIEFTNGNKQETIKTVGLTNKYSLHGNAILCKCIFDENEYKLFRTRIDDIYFSNKKAATNANGFEKRLGGRMGMFVSAYLIKGKFQIPIIVGSVHKLGKNEYKNVANYINQYKNIINYTIVAGDQASDFCNSVQLKSLSNAESRNTWPSNCERKYYGRGRGDILCGNVNAQISRKEETLLPCIDDIQLSDHSFPRVSLVIV